MQGLKILVVVLGVLILVGLAVVIVTIASRLKGPAGARPGFGAASLLLPKGCRVVEMTPAGARLALRLGEGPDCQLILFLDPETGREAGRLSLLAQP
ncbi:MAG TPA: DUF6476 family protein [Dongiaceae bacterium]|nr:DUF6476 family protein [Dongiaceae bacterium]